MDGVTTRRPVPTGLGTTLRAAGRMLRVAKSGESAGRRLNPFPPLVHLLANILICSYAQSYLANDKDGVYLSLFLVVQYSVALLITISFVGTAGAAIVNKTRLYPGSSAASYYFLLAGSVRRPEFCLFVAVGCVTPAIALSTGLVPSAGTVAITLLALIASQVACCAITARLIRSAKPLTGLVLFTIIASAAVIASVFVFRIETLASSLPLVGWATAGIRAFAAGENATGWKHLGYLALVTVALVAIIRK